MGVAPTLAVVDHLVFRGPPHRDFVDQVEVVEHIVLPLPVAPVAPAAFLVGEEVVGVEAPPRAVPGVEVLLV